MYELPNYESSSSEKQTENHEREIQCQSTRNEKAEKRQAQLTDKDEKKPKKQKAENPPASLSDKQVEKVQKQVAAIEKLLADGCEDLIRGFPDISRAFTNNYNRQRSELEAALAVLQMAAASKVGRLQTLMADTKPALAGYQEAVNIVKKQVESLESMGIVKVE